MQVLNTTIGGVDDGTVKVTVPEGSTVAKVLAEAIKALRLEAEILDMLTPVVDGQTAAMDDVVPAGAQQVTATTKVRNG